MRFPFVSRLRLEFAEAVNATLSQTIVELKEANAKLLELVEAEKVARRDDRSRSEEGPEENVSRRQRVFGADVMRKATLWARQQAAEKGQTK